ncbi:hypothetical protein EFP19_23270 [Burkholderia glumae]|nr:hypothetical protein EFP19_23270 [Burkholderia glumae]
MPVGSGGGIGGGAAFSVFTRLAGHGPAPCLPEAEPHGKARHDAVVRAGTAADPRRALVRLSPWLTGPLGLFGPRARRGVRPAASAKATGHDGRAGTRLPAVGTRASAGGAHGPVIAPGRW